VFDKADSSKIGTGEGAQAYGHGLYWAENPGVAKSYAETGAKNSQWDGYNGGKSYLIDPNVMGRRQTMVKEYNKENPSGASWTETWGTWLPNDYKGPKDAIRALQREGKVPAKPHMWLDNDGNINVSNRGANLYEANLRWPDAAREAKDPLGPQHFLDHDNPIPETMRAPLSQKMTEKFGSGASSAHGEQVWKNLVWEFKNAGSTQPAVDASKFMQQAGIPGISYMDAGSRAAGQGTRNYVTFDDALVELLNRNGRPIK
jgi:hypothetical protein